MAENQAPNIPILKSMTLDMYGKALITMSHAFVENTKKITELEQITFGKKKFAKELLKQSSILYNKIFSAYKSFEKDKELLQGEEEFANVMHALYGDIGVMMLRNIHIIKMQIGEKVEETEEFIQATQEAFLEFEGLYRKFEKMSKEFICTDATKSEKVNKQEQKEDKKQDSRQLEPTEFADFAKYFNDELFYCYIMLGKKQEELEHKVLGKKKLAKNLIDEYDKINKLSQKALQEFGVKIKSVEGAEYSLDATLYSGYIILLLSELSTMSTLEIDRLKLLYFNERLNRSEEFIQHAAKAYSNFKETYPQFLELSKKHYILLIR